MRYAITWSDGFLLTVSSLAHGMNEAAKRHQNWKEVVFVEERGRWIRFADWEAR